MLSRRSCRRGTTRSLLLPTDGASVRRFVARATKAPVSASERAARAARTAIAKQKRVLEETTQRRRRRRRWRAETRSVTSADDGADKLIVSSLFRYYCATANREIVRVARQHASIFVG